MKHFIFCMVLMLFAFHVNAQQRDTVKSNDPWKNNRAGNNYYKNKEYAKAEQKYRDALKTDSLNSVTNHNLGNSLYEQEKYADAADAYEKAARNSGGDTATNAYYNAGNAHLQNCNLDESISNYKEALKRDPNNEDARYNLALAQKLQRARMQGMKDTTGSCQKDANGNMLKKDNNGNVKTYQVDPNAKPKNGNSGPKVPLDPKKQNMSAEEARKVMNALKDSEQKTRQRINSQGSDSYYKPGRDKDW